MLHLVSADYWFSAKLEAMCTAISSSLGIDMFFFANRDLLAIRCWLTRPD